MSAAPCVSMARVAVGVDLPLGEEVQEEGGSGHTAHPAGAINLGCEGLANRKSRPRRLFWTQDANGILLSAYLMLAVCFLDKYIYRSTAREM